MYLYIYIYIYLFDPLEELDRSLELGRHLDVRVAELDLEVLGLNDSLS